MSYCHAACRHAAARPRLAVSYRRGDFSPKHAHYVKHACSTLQSRRFTQELSIRRYSHLESANSCLLTFLAVFHLSVGAKRRYLGDK